jgi:hypothetical protein
MDIANTRHRSSKGTNAHTRPASAKAAPAAAGTRFTRSQIGGRLSLPGEVEIAIAAEPGMTVRVHRGLLSVVEARNGKPLPLRANEQFTARRAARVIVHAAARSELEIEWPSPAARHN